MDFLRCFEVVSLEILQKGMLKGGKIIHHYLILRAFWQRALGKWFVLVKKKRRILESMWTSCPGLEQLKFSG